MSPAATTHRYSVFYDGNCRLCTDTIRTLRSMDMSVDVRFVDVQQPGVFLKYPQIDPATSLGQMHVISPDGTVTGGFDAIVALLPAFPSLRVFQPLLAGPFMRQLGGKVYRWLARNRYRIAGTTGCANGACRIA
jgi:predicted DCC family thiol-disulfide oxidoreductase YuxK